MKSTGDPTLYDEWPEQFTEFLYFPDSAPPTATCPGPVCFDIKDMEQMDQVDNQVGDQVDDNLVESVTRGVYDAVYNGWCQREKEAIYAATIRTVDTRQPPAREAILFIFMASLFFYLINVTLPYWKADTLPANLRRIWPLGTDDTVDGYKDEDDEDDEFDNEDEYEDEIVMPFPDPYSGSRLTVEFLLGRVQGWNRGRR
jgi:hypothetical protein